MLRGQDKVKYSQLLRELGTLIANDLDEDIEDVSDFMDDLETITSKYVSDLLDQIYDHLVTLNRNKPI